MDTERQHDAAQGFGRGALQLAAANGGYVLAGYLTTVLVARELSPESFGVFGVVMAWITLLTAVLVKGLASSMAREMADPNNPAYAAWREGGRLGFLLAVIVTIIGLCLAYPSAVVLGVSPHFELFFVAALAAISFGANAVLLAWPLGIRRFDRQAIAQVVYAIARVGLVFGGAVIWGLWGAVVGYVLAPLLSSLSLIMRRDKGEILTSDQQQRLRKSLRRGVLPISISALAISGYFIVDIFALTAITPANSEAVGAFVAYGTIAHIPFFLLQATSIAMVPTLAQSVTETARSIAIRRTMTDTAILLAGPSLLLVTAGDTVADILFGAEYHSSGLIVAPLSIATAAVTWLAGLVAIDISSRRMRGSLIISLTGLGLVAVMVIIGVNSADRFGVSEASAAAFACMVAALAAAAAITVRALLRYGALLESNRAMRGVLLGAVTSLIPFAVSRENEIGIFIVAIASGCAWLTLVVRRKLVDISK